MLGNKYILLVVFLCALPFSSIAQGFQNVTIESVDDVCFGDASQAADAEAESIVDEMMGQMGLNRNFKMRKCENINNALAHIEEDENKNLVPYILYDPEWLQQMSKKSKTDWASIGVLAHEVGHFLLYHSLNKRGSNPRWELNADRFAGHTLARMGSTLEEAQSMFQNVPEKGSSTHPGRKERLDAIKIGWMKFNNPTQKKIILNEDTPERDIVTELIINKYYKVLGGLKELSQIRQLNFKSEISETVGENLKSEAINYTLNYEQSASSLLISKTLLGADYKEEYRIQNDSLSWKYSDQKKWKLGAPPIGTTKKSDPFIFKKEKKPITKNFFDDFVLASNPELAPYQGRKRINDDECFVINLPPEQKDIGDLRKKGRRITSTKTYYFSTSTGLLYGIVEREKITPYVRGKIKNPETILFERIITNYATVSGIQFPSRIKSTETRLVNDIPQGNAIHQERIISDIVLITE